MIVAVDHPNDVAERLTGRRYTSHSAITTYLGCPLRYFFRYIEGLPEQTVSASLVFGSAIHSCAEVHYRAIMSGAPVPDLDTLMDVYRLAWQERDLESIQFPKKDDAETLETLARRMLEAFQQSDVASPAGTIIGVEEELRGELVPGCPDLLARIDLVTETEEAVTITDLKTSRSRWSADQAEGSKGQLLLYSELARTLAGGKPIRLEFAVLTKTKSPAIEVHPVRADAEQLERQKRIVERVWKSIQAGNWYPNPSPMNCGSCPFRSPCSRWTG